MEELITYLFMGGAVCELLRRLIFAKLDVEVCSFDDEGLPTYYYPKWQESANKWLPKISAFCFCGAIIVGIVYIITK